MQDKNKFNEAVKAVVIGLVCVTTDHLYDKAARALRQERREARKYLGVLRAPKVEGRRT